MKNEKKGNIIECKNNRLTELVMSRYRRLEEMMQAEGLSDQEVNFLQDIIK